MKEKGRHFRETAEASEKNPSSFADNEVVNVKQNSKELLLVTGAAVNALSSPEDANGEHDARARSSERRSSLADDSRNVRPIISPKHSSGVSSFPSKNAPRERPDLNLEKGVLALPGELRSEMSTPATRHAGTTNRVDTSSSSLDQSFRGTQKVKVPARLLREIKSPSDRSWSASRSLESSDAGVHVQESQVTPVVVRHTNGPSAWVTMETATTAQVCTAQQVGQVHEALSPIEETHPGTKGVAMTALQNAKRHPNSQCTRMAISEKQADAEVPGKHFGRAKVSQIKGLHQGEPISGKQLFVNGENRADEVKTKCFTLNDKEKSLKENFIKRADYRGAVKRVVQPTVVMTQPVEPAQSSAKEDPVVTAAAIAAAAASAATGPFLQIQQSLESQIGALVSNLQLLQQHQSQVQEERQKEQEKQVQQQVNNRLDRLEELHREQTNVLQTGAISSAQLATRSVNPTSANTEPVPPPTSTQPNRRFITSSPNGAGHVESGVPTVQYAPAAQLCSSVPERDGFRARDAHPSTSKPDLGARHRLVKNTKTQTSLQDSASSEDSPLQTPLPRKRPPVPISRYDPPRARAKGPRYDADMRPRRVHFDEPQRGPRMPAYRERMTENGHRLLNELLSSHEKPVRDHVTGDVRTTPLQLQGHPTRSDLHDDKKGHVSKHDIAPLKSETAAVMNDLGRVKDELQQALMEAEQLKADVAQQKSFEAIKRAEFPPGMHEPSPLDAYLATDSKLFAPMSSNPGTSGFRVQAPVVQHCADAERILQDVQSRRRNLETNLGTILRQRAQEDLYALVDNIPQTPGLTDDTLRIRREVDNKISEITASLQREIKNESRGPQKDEASVKPTQQKAKTGGKPPVGRGKVGSQAKGNLVTGNARNVKKTTPGKENVPNGGEPTRRSKPNKPRPAPKPTSKITPAQQEAYVSRVYGRQPHHPQRITSKAPYLHYQSPVNPRTTAVTAGLLGPGTKVSQKPQEVVRQPEAGYSRNREEEKPGTRFYFHPVADMSHVSLGEERPGGFFPVQGQLVPMAVPLGRPKTDPRLRLPINTETAAVATASPEPSVPEDAKVTSESLVEDLNPGRSRQPNVAVFNIRGKEMGEDKSARKKPRKANKQQSSLGIQVLPTVDIDSFTESSDSIDTPREPRISDIPDPVSRPDDSEYQEFRNYLAVRDTGTETEEKRHEQSEDESDDFPRIPTPENPLTLQGLDGIEEGRSYNGPPFPPQHPPLPSNTAGGVLEADAHREEALQERAMDWIEQELLARIVSEMNQPVPDPTLHATRTQPTPDSSVVSESEQGEEEEADMLAATIGLGGVQLFVDAGVPVDRGLVSNLIREVVAEKVATVLGYPRPSATPRRAQSPLSVEEAASRTPSPRGTPLSTPLPTPDYTPPVSEDNGESSPVVATPARTPTPSVSSEEEVISMSGGEGTVALESRHEDEAMVEENDKTLSEVADIKTPVVTPEATPPGTQTPASSVTTPEPSIREPEVSEQQTPLPTPQPSVSIKTPTPPPEPSILTEPSRVEDKPATEPSAPSPPPASTADKTNSPSTATISTLSPGTSTTMTTEGELSMGELIQPYVHVGIFSEGEYTVSPGMMRMAAARNLPLGQENWDASLMGRDDDSRNDLIRTALNGILRRQRGVTRATEEHECNSSSDTMRDTEDFKEDSMTDATQSEGEIHLKDPMGILLNRIQRHMASGRARDDRSEGEVGERMREPHVGRSRGLIGEGLVSGAAPPSPGEVRPQESTGNQPHSPGELTPEGGTPGEVMIGELDPTTRSRQVQPVGSEKESHMTPAYAQGGSPPSLDQDGPSSRSLHASDLFPDNSDRLPITSEQDRAVLPRLPSAQVPATSQRIQDEDHAEHELESIHSRSSSRKALPGNGDAGVVQTRLESAGKSDTEVESRESEPKAPTRIQVLMPSVDLQESSIDSEEQLDIVADETTGDISSISGGDF